MKYQVPIATERCTRIFLLNYIALFPDSLRKATCFPIMTFTKKLHYPNHCSFRQRSLCLKASYPSTLSSSSQMNCPCCQVVYNNNTLKPESYKLGVDNFSPLKSLFFFLELISFLFCCVLFFS